MKITTNLKNDIAHAPKWFHAAINQKPQEKILKLLMEMLVMHSGKQKQAAKT